MARRPQRQVWLAGWKRYVCTKCSAWRRLPPEDERNCPRCGGLMRVPVAPVRRERKPTGWRAKLKAADTPMRPWVRCEVCGGIHWKRRPIDEQCPGAGEGGSR